MLADALSALEQKMSIIKINDIIVQKALFILIPRKNVTVDVLIIA